MDMPMICSTQPRSAGQEAHDDSPGENIFCCHMPEKNGGDAGLCQEAVGCLS